MEHEKSVRKWLLGVGSILAISVVTACGSDVGDSDASDEGEITQVRLAIGTQDLNVGYPTATLPITMGWFEEEGLEVEIIVAQNSSQVAQALVGGQADIGMMVPETAVIGRAVEEIPLTNIYPLTRYQDYQFGVRPDSGIETFADLEGLTIGYPDMASGAIPLAHRIFEENGFAADDVGEIASGYGAAAADALYSGEADALFYWQNFWPVLDNAGYEIELLDRADWQYDMWGWSVYSTDDYVDANPAVIEGIGRAMSKSIVFLQENLEAGVYLFWEDYPDYAPADWDDEAAFAADYAILEQVMVAFEADQHDPDFAWGSQDLETWESMVSILFDVGELETEVDAEQLFNNSHQDAYTDFDVDEIIDEARDWERTE